EWRKTDSARELGNSTDVIALIATSKAAHEQHRKRRLAALWGGFGALGIFAVVVATLAIMERRQATQAETSRERSQHLLALSYQETGRQLLLDGYPLRALPYLVAARKEGEDGPSLRMLFWAATRFVPLAPPLEHQSPVTEARFSPDGKSIVTVSWDHTARTWDASTGIPLAPRFRHQAPVTSAAFSPDSARIVTASEDHTARVWDAS